MEPSNHTTNHQEQTTQPRDAANMAKTLGHSEPTERFGLRRAWMYGALAMELTAGVVGGGVGGYFLDRWQGTSPVWTLLLLLLGFTGGFVLMLRGFLKLEGESK